MFSTKEKVVRGLTEIEPILDAIYPYGGYIAGGYVRWMCSTNQRPSSPGDVDIYCRFEDSFSKIKTKLEDKGFSAVFTSDVSINYRTTETTDKTYVACPKLQLIKPRSDENLCTVGDPEEVCSSFDFTVSRIFLNSNGRYGYCDEDFSEHEKKKRIVIKNIHCPISSIIRVIKYAKKGYFVSFGELGKLYRDWDSRSSDYKENLLTLLEDFESDEKMTDETYKELINLLKID